MAERGRLLVVSHPSVVSVNQEVYARLRQLGWEVLLVQPDRWRHDYAPASFAPEALPELAGALRPLRVALSGRPQRHVYLARTGRVIREFAPDVAFLEQEPFSIPALQWGTALRQAGVPFGVQGAENLDRDFPRLARWIRGRTLRHAAFVTARSPAAGELVRRWGAAGSVVLAPHPVPAWSRPERPEPGPFTIGFAGRLVPEKGIDDLLAAVSLLEPGARVLLVGDGPLAERLADARVDGATVDLRRNVRHDEMARAYAEMDVLVLPSRSSRHGAEQFGRVLVEALWCDVPVVGSDCGEIPWVIEATGGGRVFPEGDVEALAGVLAELRAQPDTRTELAHRGRAATERLFSVDAAAHVLDEALLAARETRAATAGDTRRTIALVAHGIHDHGGMERAFYELVRRGHERYRFVVIAEELAPELRPFVTWKRVRVPRRPIPLKFVAFFVLAGLRLRRVRADLVHTMGAIVPNAADLACVQFCHAGYRATVGRGPNRDRPLLRRVNTAVARGLGSLAEQWCYRRRVRMLAAVSPGVRRELARSYPDVPIAVTPNGVETARLVPDMAARRELREANGAANGTVVALFVGGDWDHKGLAHAIRGLAVARRLGPRDVRLWVVGRGDERRFGELARSGGVDDLVTFFGPRPRLETERFFQAADLFVLPTLYETFSLVAYEAAASGLPVVATRVNGVEDLVGKDEAGVLVPRTAEAVGQAVARLAGDAEERARLGEAGRRRARSYGWDRSAESVLALYDSLSARSPEGIGA